jgi:hypothetical protein
MRGFPSDIHLIALSAFSESEKIPNTVLAICHQLLSRFTLYMNNKLMVWGMYEENKNAKIQLISQ